MPRPSGKINELERAICARTAEVRNAARFPQREFASFFGITRNQLSAIESGCTPLRYDLARDIFKSFDVNPAWAATGIGDMYGYVRLPGALELKARPDALFSELFFNALLPSFENKTPDSASQLNLRFQRAHVNAVQIKSWFIEFVPDGYVEKLEKGLADFWTAFSAMLPPEDPRRRLQRAIWFKRRKKQIEESSAGAQISDQTIHLTQTATHAKSVPVQNQWHRLKQRIQKATGNPGGKSALAKFLNVDLTQLSKWLTDAKSAREPGADYTLKMLQWVQERESQQ